MTTKQKKMYKPRLEVKVLSETSKQLFGIAGLPSLQSSDWYQTRLEIEMFATTLDGYATMLNEANETQQCRQSAKTPPCQVSKYSYILSMEYTHTCTLSSLQCNDMQHACCRLTINPLEGAVNVCTIVSKPVVRI